MTLYYQDPQDPSNFIPIKSRTLSGEHILARDIVALPGSVETDIGESRGFLATLSGAVTANIMSVALQTSANVIGKLAANAGVNIGSVEFVGPATGTVTAVTSSATVVTLLAANTARVGALVVNNSTATLYLKLGSAASLTSWSVQLDPGAYWEMPRRYYTGIITGIWSAVNGDAKVTEAA